VENLPLSVENLVESGWKSGDEKGKKPSVQMICGQLGFFSTSFPQTELKSKMGRELIPIFFHSFHSHYYY